MRLTPEQVAIIKQAAVEVFGDRVSVKLFGSRLNDAVRGGDIDLLLESPDVIENRMDKMLTLTARLQLRLGDQPIDVLVIDPATPRKPYRHALATAVTLP